MIAYITTIKKSWTDVRGYAKSLHMEHGGTYVETPPYMNSDEMLAFTEMYILLPHMKGENVIVASMEELPILRILRRIWENMGQKSPWIRGKDVVVYCLRENNQKDVLNVDERGEFIERWTDGFFEYCSEELF